MTELTPEDIAAARKDGQGDLKRLLLLAAGISPSMPTQRTSSEPDAPCYHIARPGAWPCGTAATGPMPGPSCPDCTLAA
ncbi:hypothetical protein PUR59_30525 [Streptomyces sp. SP18ES09]|uniref:hypothetical protein n=1 Tax=Streptomyces sp. SP18ES09 TaxID=3002532 RepID=UPI002E75DC44|nr:hypothetical protein [Streptomyces sp. SP18ES09]MEE1819337.1 hypothetical protein [Streptomyces sp. SP18ES09]